MDKNILKNKNCFVTGSTGGIGKEICIQLARSNCNLFLTARDRKSLIKLKKELLKINSKIKVEFFEGDLTKLNELKKILFYAKNFFTQFDILINSAGIFIIKSIHDLSQKDYENCINLNVRAPFILCKEIVPQMISNNWGRIVNIGSSSSYNAFEGGTLYCASKFGILGLSRSLHVELKDHNVRTFCISPGSTKTEMAKISTDQDFTTFLNPTEIAKYVIFVISFDNELVSEEIRLNRMILK